MLLDGVTALDGHFCQIVLEHLFGDFSGTDEVVTVQFQAAEGCAISQRNLPCTFFHVTLLPNSFTYRLFIL